MKEVADLAGKGIGVRVGDYLDYESLLRAQKALIKCLPVLLPFLTDLLNIITYNSSASGGC